MRGITHREIWEIGEKRSSHEEHEGHEDRQDRLAFDLPACEAGPPPASQSNGAFVSFVIFVAIRERRSP
jgi:hypothetical protein